MCQGPWQVQEIKWQAEQIGKAKTGFVFIAHKLQWKSNVVTSCSHNAYT